MAASCVENLPQQDSLFSIFRCGIQYARLLSTLALGSLTNPGGTYSQVGIIQCDMKMCAKILYQVLVSVTLAYLS